jgi:hypothetical protein
MLIDIEQTKLMRDRLYDQKIKEIENKFKEDSQIRKELKMKHDLKLEHARTKND